MTIQFINQQLRAFEILSHDRNPIHNDPVYSRSTQFGRPIVYGMCGVLLGLGHWARGRAFRLTRLVGRFTSPLFELIEYDLTIEEEGNKVVIEYLETGNIQMSFHFVWEELETSNMLAVPVQTPSLFRPLDAAVDTDLEAALVRWQGRDYLYSVQSQHLSQLLPELCLHPAQMPLEQ